MDKVRELELKEFWLDSPEYELEMKLDELIKKGSYN